MKKIIFSLIIILFFSCKAEIKNPNPKVEVEEGTKVETTVTENPKPVEVKKVKAAKSPQSLLGFWVGYFEKDLGYAGHQKDISIDEAFHWNRNNKINISIDKIQDSVVIGHSVVAGNDRPFKGTLKVDENGGYFFHVKEPGDHKYDGEFTFTINKNQLEGKWAAYKDIDIPKRKYDLRRRRFQYNPDINLDRSGRYINWHQSIDERKTYEVDGDVEEWISREFASATDLIYKVNASNRLLTKEEVENLKRGDLTIIRNTIYARHGYSFKHRPLRVFFDAQDWYIPVHTDIKKDFTELEKKNIRLLLKYEKNASEYYDYFGRG